MSLSYTESSIIGGPLESTVITQLNKRKEVISKNQAREDDELLYLFGNTGWVRIHSSVDIAAGADKTKNFSNGEAKAYVLSGGTISNGVSRGGFLAYEDSFLLGSRPMAGITDFSVKSKNSFGTLRIATVNIRVNSPEQLDTIEQLYFRPGMSILLEWGHSVYFSNNGSFVKDIPTYGPDFLEPKRKQEILTSLERLKKSSDGNYDAMYGIIKNFQWSYNLDGGYDCQLDVVSTGDLIESMTVLISSQTTAAETDTIENEYQNITDLHTFCNIIKNTPKEQSAEIPGKLQQAIPEIHSTLKQNLEQVGRPYDSNGRILFVNLVGVGGNNQNTGIANSRYIPISTLLELINRVFTLKDQTKQPIVEFYYGQSKLLPSENPDLNTIPNLLTPYLTFPGHFSIDPGIAIIPKPYSNPGYGYKVQNQATPVNKDGNDILDIFLNVDYILDCYDIVTDEEPQAQTIFTFIRTILKGLTESLGYVNNFDLHFDDSEFRYYIVDRRVTPSHDKLYQSEIDLVGLKSQIENITFTTGLSSKVTSLIAISAQANSSDLGTDVLMMQKWNAGLKDRHMGTRQVSDKGIVSPNQKVENSKQRVVNYVNAANEVEPSDIYYLKYNVAETLGLSTAHKYLMTQLGEYYTKAGLENPSGIIPFKLQFTIQGISGIKIGQAFRLANYSILPGSYKDNVAFIVTALEHKVGAENRWVTDIGTTMILSSRYTLLDQDSEPPTYVPQPIDLGPAVEPELDEDPAPTINRGGIGAGSYSSSAVAKDLSNLFVVNGALDIKNSNHLIFLNEPGAKNNRYINPATGKPDFALHPKAAKAWFAWRDEMKSSGVTYRVSSAYRDFSEQAFLDRDSSENRAASAGTSPHGFGGAIDFGNLYSIVGGSTDPQVNLNGRKSTQYKQIAEIGAKYDWYNPWRLSDGKGTDEMWHFEYWGP